METQSKKVAVLILNWNGRDLLERFLPSVCTHNSTFAEIVVVDNASTDASIVFLKEFYPHIKRIEFNVNFGFAEGYNKAISLVENEYVVLLNSDVRVTENWLIDPISFLNNNKEYAACQPKILDEKDPTKFEYAGACGGYVDYLGYPFCRGRVFDYLETDTGQYNTVKDIFWASGAAMFVRRELYIEVGGLDASFFAHQEEIDLCWRFLNKNQKIACIPTSTVYHLGGASLDKMNPKKTYLNFRNNLVMLLKNLPISALPLIFIRMVLDAVAGLKFISEGKFNHCWAIVKAHFSFYTRIPSTLLKRKNTQQIPNSLMFFTSIIVHYFIKKNKTFSDIINSIK
jgi:GT2 family glycosyltransferase